MTQPIPQSIPDAGNAGVYFDKRYDWKGDLSVYNVANLQKFLLEFLRRPFDFKEEGRIHIQYRYCELDTSEKSLLTWAEVEREAFGVQLTIMRAEPFGARFIQFTNLNKPRVEFDSALKRLILTLHHTPVFGTPWSESFVFQTR